MYLYKMIYTNKLCFTVSRILEQQQHQQHKLIQQHEDDNSEVSHWNGNATASSADLVWLVHRGGFCLANVVRTTTTRPQSLENGGGSGTEASTKVVIELQHNGEQLTVEEDDVEKANPDGLDLVEDICQLGHLNEASVLHCLRQRYANNLIHTRAGPILMVVNPMAPLSLYSEKVSGGDGVCV